MRLLVTGASGFLGRNLLRALPADWDVTATFHRSGDFPAFLAAQGLGHVTPVRVDLSAADPAEIAARVGDRFDAAVLLAANGDPAFSVTAPRADLAANAVSVVALLEAVAIGRVVFVSSGAVYDGLRGDVHPGVRVEPRLPYAISKLAAELYVRHFVAAGRAGSAVNVRFFGAYGPYEPERKVFTRLVRAFALERRTEFTIRGDGRNLIDAMHADDLVRGLLALLSAAPVEPCETIDLSAGSPVTVAELVRTAARVFGVEARLLHEGAVPEYIEFRSTDTTMRDRLGFEPRVPLGDGLERLAAHLRSAPAKGPAGSRAT